MREKIGIVTTRISSLIRTLPSVQEFHLLGSYLSSRTLPPVWNFTKPQRSYNIFIKRRRGIFLGAKVSFNYSMMLETTPEPTVLPPSRIAKRSPSSIAIGVISSTVISTLSPGRHISTSAGRPITPVTSVVLK